LAAIVSVEEAQMEPKLTLDVNVNGTATILEESVKAEVDKFIYASSAAVYGESTKIPISEDVPLSPKNIYGASKACGELLINAYAESYGLRTVILRYFNVYGPALSMGETSGVILKFIYAALKNKPVTIFGDGRQTRDFIYVDDVAQINVLSIEKNICGCYNIGTGIATRILDLAKKIIRLTKSNSQIVHLKERVGDIRFSVADITKIKNDLGWEPRYNLDKGLISTINYLRPLIGP